MGPNWTREAEAFEAFCSGAAQTNAPYIWGGKGDTMWTPQGMVVHTFYKSDRVPWVFDCSGLMACALRFATSGSLDLRASHSANAMFKDWPEATVEDVLTAWFFGKDDKASHVEFHVAEGECYGARGGTKETTTIQKAREDKASVQFGKVKRPDFIGARKIPRVSP